MPTTIPLRIECRLSTPWIAPRHGLNLDSLLAWAVVERAKAEHGSESTGDTLEPSAAHQTSYADLIGQLPLSRHDCATGNASDWVWCASAFAAVGWLGQERRQITARTPVDEIARLTGRGTLTAAGGSVIDTVRGPAKNDQVFLTIEHIEGLSAWCIGEPDEIMDLLNSIDCVGVKSRMGMGSLTEFDDGTIWKISEDPEALERWKLRPAPVQLHPECEPALGTFQPPYWQGRPQRIWRPAGQIRLPSQTPQAPSSPSLPEGA